MNTGRSCPSCGGKKYERAKTCRACTKFVSGEQHPMWNGGRHETTQGYVIILKPEHPRADVRGYVFEQNVIAERALGHYLPEKAVVHHHNEIRSDNGPGNLVICEDKAYHEHLHTRKRAYLATGLASVRWCPFCETYEMDPSVEMAIYGSSFHHRACRNIHLKNERDSRKHLRLEAHESTLSDPQLPF